MFRGIFSAVSCIVILVFCIVISALTMVILALNSVMSTIWYLFLTDRDFQLALYERFGKGVGQLKGKVVWITGATSVLGKALALKLAEIGAKLILTSTTSDTLEDIKSECCEKSNEKLGPDDILIFPLDLSQVKKADVDTVVDHFGKVDMLISNAGLVNFGELSEISIEDDEDLFQTNFFDFVNLSKHVAELFIKQRNGQFVIVSSIAAKMGIPGLAGYCASKHAQRGYFDALRMEYSKFKVYVTVVCAGFFRSTEQTENEEDLSQEGSDKESKAVESIGKEDKEYPTNRTALDCERVAHLMLVAAANQVHECRVVKQPFLMLSTLANYYPDFHKKLMGWIFTKRRISMIYEGRWPRLLSWRPSFVL